MTTYARTSVQLGRAYWHEAEVLFATLDLKYQKIAAWTWATYVYEGPEEQVDRATGIFQDLIDRIADVKAEQILAAYRVEKAKRERKHNRWYRRAWRWLTRKAA